MLIIRIIEDYGRWQVSLCANGWEFREALEQLKSRVPDYLREYDPDGRCWLIDSAAEANLWGWRRFAERHLQATIITDDDEPDPAESRRQQRRQYASPREDAITAAYKSLFLIPGAPAPVIKAVYRTLTTIYHPDKEGGNHEKMVELNLAFERLSREVAA